MTTRRVLRAIAWIVVNIIRELFAAAEYLFLVVVIAFAVADVLPLALAIPIALLGGGIVFGYLKARAIERARERGEQR